MDPNAALRMINDADRVDAETREIMRGLHRWLSRGGFQPDWDAYPTGTRRYRKAHGQSSRARKKSGGAKRSGASVGSTRGHAAKTKGSRDWVVVLDGRHADGTATYLGEIDRGLRQGVRRLENAMLFTKTGAQRVLAGFPIDATAGRAYIVQLVPSEKRQSPRHARARSNKRLNRRGTSHATTARAFPAVSVVPWQGAKQGNLQIGDIVQRADATGKNPNRYVIVEFRGPWILTNRISGPGVPGIIQFPSAQMLKRVG